MRKILTLFSFFLLALVAHAHGLWIEVAGIGTVGQPQTVNVFFGDPAERMPTERWFGNLREVQPTLVSPSGKETPLPALTLSANHGNFTYTPKEAGTYLVQFAEMKDGAGTYNGQAYLRELISLCYAFMVK